MKAKSFLFVSFCIREALAAKNFDEFFYIRASLLKMSDTKEILPLAKDLLSARAFSSEMAFIFLRFWCLINRDKSNWALAKQELKIIAAKIDNSFFMIYIFNRLKIICCLGL